MCIYYHDVGADTERSGTMEELGHFEAVGVDIELQQERSIGCTGGCNGGMRIRCVVGNLRNPALAQICLLYAFGE